MDQLICASLSHTHYYWYEVGMLKVPYSTFILRSQDYSNTFIYNIILF